MITHLIISENHDVIAPQGTDALILTPEEYIENISQALDIRQDPKLKILNLCRSYEYLSKGYYCSLLAEARGQRCIPPVDSVVMINWKRLYNSFKPELDGLLAKNYKIPLGDEIAKTFIFYFGRSEDEKLEFLSRRIFDIFRMPLVTVVLKYFNGQWIIGDIRPMDPVALPHEKIAFFNKALSAYIGKAWLSRKKPSQEKYWLAILHDPAEQFPPSNKAALEQVMKAAKRHNVYSELITKDDMPALLEYDALFIRETTAIDHHTYRFAYKAENEGIPAIDDTASIIRCSNKVFLHEAMISKKLPLPKSELLDLAKAKKIEKDIEFPLILKIPDGSFSRGIVKVKDVSEYRAALQKLFTQSDIVLMQEFLESDFDWRIGILGGQPLYACRYFMAEGHWQIYNHKAKGKKIEGRHETLALKRVPKAVLKAATAAASIVGNGLYGVDLKENEHGVYIIEVNDNPNIDRGVEDQVAGNALYDALIDHFTMRVNESF